MKNMWMFGITGLSLFVSGCIFEPKLDPIEPEEGSWTMVVIKGEASADCEETGADFIGDTLELLLEKSAEGTILVTLEDIAMEAQLEDNVITASGSQSPNRPEVSSESEEGEPEDASQDSDEQEEIEEQEDVDEQEEVEEQEEIEEQEESAADPIITVDLEGQLLEVNEMEGKLLIEITSDEKVCSLDLDFFASIQDSDPQQEEIEEPIGEDEPLGEGEDQQ